MVYNTTLSQSALAHVRRKEHNSVHPQQQTVPWCFGSIFEVSFIEGRLRREELEGLLPTDPLVYLAHVLLLGGV